MPLVLLAVLALMALACSDGSVGASTGEPPPPSTAPVSGKTVSAAVAAHHWLALGALHTDDVETARHHVAHVVAAVTGTHREAMVGVLADLDAGRLHAAEHTVNEMLAGRAELNLTGSQLHLLMAVEALSEERRDDAGHHLAHFIEHSSPSGAVRAAGVVTALSEGRVEAAAVALGALTLELSQNQAALRSCNDVSASVVLHGGQLPIAVVMDSEWVGGQAALLMILDEARVALEGLGLSLELVETGWWDAPAVSSMSVLVDALVEVLAPRTDVALTVAFVAGETDGRSDGFYSASERAIVVKRQSDHSGGESAVLVHEVGHYLGLRHEIGTYMQSLGFSADTTWSDCQRAAVLNMIER